MSPGRGLPLDGATGRAVRFVVTNLGGTLVETAVLWALCSWAFDSFAGRYLLAPLLAFQVAVLNNYTVAYLWVWRERVPRLWRDYCARLPRYEVSVVGAFAGRLALIALLGRMLRLDPVVCNLAALLVSGLFNFGSQERWVFAPQADGGPRECREIGASAG
jgi:putative flippase GtrA